ncbi:hypothetical protein UlMin_013301 [Ulmus minor]
MGFDNECILNIQSLAGEYFCPVCRLLVYPNEAWQSQCTHLYCKPCLTYVVSTTRACPYDGYLVTEADSKPLIESNKSLAETVGKIAVHCLYHRSGCSWQGPLSECTSHCSSCAFGNSPVVCNRCGVQILHNQVQEHAQSCPGVQPQAQQTKGATETSTTATATNADQSQAAVVASQAQASQNSAALVTGKPSNEQSNSSSQAQGVIQAAVPTTEQWYQQYYQQYPGYESYQQYYPYQQMAVPQYQQQHLQVHAPQSTGMQPQPEVQPQQPQPQLQASLIQAPLATQPQNQAQINTSQQLHPAVPSQTQTYLPAHGYQHAQPQTQLPPQPPQHVQISLYQQPHPFPQVQQQTQSQVQPQHHPPSQPQSLLQAQLPGQPQHHPQLNPPFPNQNLNANFQPQLHYPSPQAVTGHHSFLLPQNYPQVQTGVPQQYPVQVQPHVIPHPQPQNPVQMQSHLSQQPPPVVRPPHSHATIPNQQSALLPSRSQVQNVLAPPQQPIQSQFQQPGQPLLHHTVVQPGQQPVPQQHYQQQLPMSSQLRPQGQTHVFPLRTQAYPQLPQSQPQNPLGRPSMPNHGIQSPYMQLAAGVGSRPLHPGGNPMQLLPEQHSGSSSKPTMSEQQADRIFENSMAQQAADISSQKTVRIVSNESDSTPGIAANVGEVKNEKSETDMKSKDFDHKFSLDDKSNVADTTLKEIPQMRGEDGKPFLSEHGGPMFKLIVKEGNRESSLNHPGNGKPGEVVAKDMKNVLNVGSKQVDHSTLEFKDAVDGSQQKKSLSQAAELEEQGGKLTKDAISMYGGGSQVASTTISDSSSVPGSEKKSSQLQAVGFVETSRPIIDQGRHQLPSHYGTSTAPQRPGAPLPGPPHQTQGPGHLPIHFRPQRPGHVSGQPSCPPEHVQPLGSIPDPAASFGRGAVQDGPAPPSSELKSVAPQGPYNQGHLPQIPHAGAFKSSQGEPAGALPPGAFGPHAGIMARATPHGPKGQMNLQHPTGSQDAGVFLSQRPNYMDGKRPDPNTIRMTGTTDFDSTSILGSRDARFNPLHDERLNSFPVRPDRHVSDQAKFEDNLTRFPRPPPVNTEPIPKFGNFPRPFDRGLRGLKYDAGLKLDAGPDSRFLSSYHGGSNEAEKRLVGHYEDTIGRTRPTRRLPDFLGPVPADGGHHKDGLAPRSPAREHPGVPHGFGGPGLDNVHGREVYRFGEPLGNPVHESRFSMLPGHVRKGKFEGPGNKRRNDLIVQDSFPDHLWMGEHLGPHNLHGHFHLEENIGFGAHKRHGRIREMGRPESFDSFHGGSRPNYLHLGEPGFSSSLPGFPNDDGFHTIGDMEFDRSRKRKLRSMGWCRICKIDCETVDGLDYHAQTREHQKMAMDMVIIIKQNAKKKKLTGDQSSLGDASKSRNADSESCGKNN